ncbi:type II methionyl aminopeptidase [Candidatus Woesearchaeota archaeon]|nr:type II methionyl aminopeptidase [Candidatus Woesearchaeota archaeon]
MDKEILGSYIKAGKVAAQVRKEGLKKLAIPDTSFLEVMDYCEKRIIELKGQIAWAQLAVNEVAAHYCPEEDDTSVSKEGQLIKIDVGVHINGYIADTAATVEVGSSKQYKDYITAAQNALKAAMKLARPGTPLYQLGEAQISEAEALGFTTVKNLSGHTLNQYKVHGGTSIPAYNNKDKRELQDNEVIAIEPFVTNGTGLIKERNPATIFMVEQLRSSRSLYGKKILESVKSQNGLPFTTRWLTRTLGKTPTLLGLKQLQQERIIQAYPPLVEVSKGMVAQFENSMIVKDTPIVYTKEED